MDYAVGYIIRSKSSIKEIDSVDIIVIVDVEGFQHTFVNLMGGDMGQVSFVIKIDEAKIVVV